MGLYKLELTWGWSELFSLDSQDSIGVILYDRMILSNKVLIPLHDKVYLVQKYLFRFLVYAEFSLDRLVVCSLFSLHSFLGWVQFRQVSLYVYIYIKVNNNG